MPSAKLFQMYTTLVLCFPSSQNYTNTKSFSPEAHAAGAASIPVFTKATSVAMHTTAPALESRVPCLTLPRRLPDCFLPNT